MQYPCTEYNESSSSVIYQSLDVGLPISLIPEVKVGKMQVKCCSEPAVAFLPAKCDTDRLEIMVTQTLLYKIPIEYSVASNVSDTICNCKQRSCLEE